MLRKYIEPGTKIFEVVENASSIYAIEGKIEEVVIVSTGVAYKTVINNAYSRMANDMVYRTKEEAQAKVDELIAERLKAEEAKLRAAPRKNPKE